MILIKVAIILTVGLSAVQGKVIKSEKMIRKSDVLTKKKPSPIEPDIASANYNTEPFKPFNSGLRDYPPVVLTDNFRSVQVANSFNGYGLISGSTNPIAYQPEKLNYDDEYGAIFAAFRMLVPDDPTMTGYLGVSLSMNGLDWVTSTDPLNSQTWSGQALNGARYPSAVMSLDGRPTAVWGEYTGDTDCYGDWYPTDADYDLGGRALYLFDQAQVDPYVFDPEGAEFNALPPQDLMPFNYLVGGCYADNSPIDLWIANAFMVDGPTNPAVVAMFQEGLGNGRNYLFYNDPNQPTYIAGQLNPSFSLMFDPGWLDSSGDSLFASGTTSGPDFHINPDGVGYMVQRAYNNLSDTEDPVLATLWFRKTENYGISWTGDAGDGGATGTYGEKYFYISDSIMTRLSDSLYSVWEESDDSTKLWLKDTIYYSNDPRPFVPTPGFFLWYEFDVRADRNEGLHVNIATYCYVCPDSAYTDSTGKYFENGCLDLDNDGIADSTYLEGRFGSSGMVHFYFPDPIDNPNNAHATLVHDMSDSYNADWVDYFQLSSGDYGSQQYFFPSITLSSDDDSDVIWYTGSAGTRFEYSSDSSLWSPRDVDLFLSRSTDNGVTWSELENVSNTAGTIQEKLVEVGAHISDIATDDDVYILYQMPDFSQPQYGDGIMSEFEEYLMSVHAGYYSTNLLGVDSENSFHPIEFTLDQNYPNPFNPFTKIQYNLFQTGNVRLDLYDIRGSKVKTLVHERKQGGVNEYIVDGSSLASGVYFYTLDVDGVSTTRKMLLLK